MPPKRKHRDAALEDLPPRRLTLAGRIVRAGALAAYYGFATHLPDYAFPFGNCFRGLRAAVCRSIFREAGEWINVEGKVFFGDGRDVVLGHNSSLGHGSRVYGVITGTDVMIGPNCTFLKESHTFDDPSRPIRDQGYGPISLPRIEDGAWVGEGVIVLPGRVVGAGSIVGAGSVVTHDIPPFTVAAGNPARVLKNRPGIDASS